MQPRDPGSTSRVLITGSSGRIGRVLDKGLSAEGMWLRLFDKVPRQSSDPDAVTEGVEFVLGDLTDLAAVDRATRGIDCVVHLAGIPAEAEFDSIVEANIRGTYHVLEGARRNGVKRVVLASTNHVIGFYPSDVHIDEIMPPRPDTLYAASKIYGEALGRLYHDKHGLEFISVRIGSFRTKPKTQRELATWLSHGDAVRLFLACITASDVEHLIVYGASANSRLRWRDSAASKIGYIAEDSADSYEHGALPWSQDDRFHGGLFTRADHIGDFKRLD